VVAVLFRRSICQYANHHQCGLNRITYICACKPMTLVEDDVWWCLACFQKYADDFASSDDGNHDLEIMRLPRWSFSITRLFLNVWSGFVGLSNFLDFPTPLLLSTLIIVELGVHYPLLLIFNFSRGNAEPKHIVVLYYERSPQKKFSTWNAKNFYRLVIRHNRSFDLGNGSNKFG